MRSFRAPKITVTITDTRKSTTLSLVDAESAAAPANESVTRTVHDNTTLTII
jgi:hypothetical protein